MVKNLTLLLLLWISFIAGAQTVQDSTHMRYHTMHKKDPRQRNPYAFANSIKVKKLVAKPNKNAN